MGLSSGCSGNCNDITTYLAAVARLDGVRVGAGEVPNDAFRGQQLVHGIKLVYSAMVFLADGVAFNAQGPNRLRVTWRGGRRVGALFLHSARQYRNGGGGPAQRGGVPLTRRRAAAAARRVRASILSL